SHELFCRMLNELYDLHLVQTDRIQQNFPAIDLGDEDSKQAFQITTEKAGSKIQKTVDTYLKHGLAERYGHLRILLIGQKQTGYKSVKVPDGVDFDPETDILDLRDLLHAIEKQDTEKLHALATIIGEEIAAPRYENDELVQVDLGRIPSSAGRFVGRTEELLQIDSAVTSADTPLVELVAKGGEGKTSLLNRWIENCACDGWGQSKKVFGWSFYSQGLNESEASSDLFFNDALRFFGYEGEIPLSPAARGKRLAERVWQSNGLMILDGVEPLQHPPGPNGGSLKDAGIRTLLRTIALTRTPCTVLLTTRMPIADLDDFRQRRVKSIPLPPLDVEAARSVLASGALGATDEQLDVIANGLARHALSVQLAARFINEALDGDVTQWQETNLTKQDAAEGGHAFRVLNSYETWFSRDQDEHRGIGSQLLEIVRMLGLFDRPVQRDILFRLFDSDFECELNKTLAGKDETHLRRALAKLSDLGLIQASPGNHSPVDCHPLVRQYFANRLLEFGKSSNRKMHSVVFAELQKLAPELPANARENAILFQAVRHGKLAGKYQKALELYEKRINHSTATFVWLRLGQYSDVINCMGNFVRQFPDSPIPSLEKADQRLVMNQMGCALMAAGRPRDAVKALVKTVEIIHQDDRNGSSAATNLNNVAECLFFVGIPSSMAQFAAHAASAIECTIRHAKIEGTPPKEIPWGTGLNARLLYCISLAQAGLLDESLRALDVTEDWFRECYQNADQLYVTQLRYWRSHLLSNCLLGLPEIKLNLVSRVERVLSETHAQAIPDDQEYFGPFDQSVFHLSRAELRLALLIAMIERRIETRAANLPATSDVLGETLEQIELDLDQADERMSMNANRLWIGLIQTRQLQLTRVKEMLGVIPKDSFDFNATLTDVLLLSKQEGLRLHATDALLEQAHRARMLGDEAMVVHCLKEIEAFPSVHIPYPFDMRWSENAPSPFVSNIPADLRFLNRGRERRLLANPE
ncbi:SMEK domain-containing protein, partial [Rubripirellula amarantea]|nr:SMEK domain-containing protein [Rubripirellula amarantea]